MKGFLALAAYAATIPAANWMIGNIGACAPDAPCVIPVGLGLYAPSGVLMVGASLVLRDAVHSALGIRWAVAAIIIGAALSALIAPTALVAASVAAFALAEALDLAIYAPLRSRRLWLAVLASGVAGAVADSAAFLWIAFGSMDLLAEQVVGKLYASFSVALAIFARGKVTA